MDLEKIKSDIEAAVPGCRLQIVLNGSPSGQHSLLLGEERAVEVAEFLRDDPELHLDYCSNVSGVDWLDAETSEKVKVKKLVEGVEDILQELEFLIPRESVATPRFLPANLTQEEEQVYAAIELDETPIDSITQSTGLPSGTVSSTLLRLEMKRLVRQLPGKMFVRTS